MKYVLCIIILILLPFENDIIKAALYQDVIENPQPSVTCWLDRSEHCMDIDKKPVSSRKYLAIYKPNAIYKGYQYGIDEMNNYVAYIYYE